MYKALLAKYWNWRLAKDLALLEALTGLYEECIELGCAKALGEVTAMMWEVKHAVSSAELQLFKYKGVRT